ncbi:zinc transport system ATP-binding protein [Arcanobacterium wilhelmae]|uniref:Zinc transport system ATP-binding protein n=1 Tax=Arcanobacterium wilhelmae TaxID=1803177 RepID=A0ABT9N945_9ACTO|nr:metal ABC transporter ATP-binding protein [Arcanobacterium wilhelmae]MDP9800232.1 zinc transport system ATP-binding protein [Arcanobacterium wilhelmae]WFN89671.1 metal ABC transporter ATP-binding protein [Arcanobacterium wilhelmae]
MHVIEASRLNVRLGATRILNDVSFTVTQGETLAVLGANGSGKTTLIKTLVGIHPIESGTVTVFGTPITNRSHVAWGRIGYAPQRVTTTSGVPSTALETVMSGMTYGRHLLPRRGAKAAALAALEQVGLAHRAHESVQTFSGGQQQRVLIARALVKNPDLIVLDEPFAGVDSDSRDKIIATLATARERGATTVLILHELYGLETLIDSTLVLEAGRVASLTTGPDCDHLDEHAPQAPHFRTPHMGGTVR